MTATDLEVAKVCGAIAAFSFIAAALWGNARRKKIEAFAKRHGFAYQSEEALDLGRFATVSRAMSYRVNNVVRLPPRREGDVESIFLDLVLQFGSAWNQLPFASFISFFRYGWRNSSTAWFTSQTAVVAFSKRPTRSRFFIVPSNLVDRWDTPDGFRRIDLPDPAEFSKRYLLFSPNGPVDLPSRSFCEALVRLEGWWTIEVNGDGFLAFTPNRLLSPQMALRFFAQAEGLYQHVAEAA